MPIKFYKCSFCTFKCAADTIADEQNIEDHELNCIKNPINKPGKRGKSKKVYEIPVVNVNVISICQDKKQVLLDLGFTRHSIDRNRDGVIKTFLDNGFEWVNVKFKDSKSRKSIFKPFFIKNEEALLNYANDNKLEILVIKRLLNA